MTAMHDLDIDVVGGNADADPALAWLEALAMSMGPFIGWPYPTWVPPRRDTSAPRRVRSHRRRFGRHRRFIVAG